MTANGWNIDGIVGGADGALEMARALEDAAGKKA